MAIYDALSLNFLSVGLAGKLAGLVANCNASRYNASDGRNHSWPCLAQGPPFLEADANSLRPTRPYHKRHGWEC